MKRQEKTHQIALMGLLFALACVLSVAESMLSAPLMLPPGIKLGLANIVVMYAFLWIHRKAAFTLVILKALFTLMVKGVTASVLSLCGGLTSFFMILLFYAATKGKVSLLFLSIAGAVAHNIGQLAAASLLLNKMVFSYTPILLLSGLIVGSLTAVLLKNILPFLEKYQALYENKK